MAKKFLTGIDLNKNELLNASIQNLANNPLSPVSGQIYYNSSDGTLRYWSGSAWNTLAVGGSISEAISAAIDLLTTSDIEEGTNLYFTDERAQDAVGNSVGTGLSYNDTSGSISVTANTYDAYGSALAAETNSNSYADSLASNYDPAGAAATVAGDLTTHISDTSTHGVTGDVVGTSDTQTLSNKTFSDSLKFSTGLNWSAIHANGNDLNIDGSNDIVLTTNTGDIVLNANVGAYVTSASAGNQIATHSYVDAAISGLNWKESAHLFAKTINIPLTGATGTVVIDSHAALGSTETGYRLLLSGQTTTTENGIYVYTDNGSTYTLTRTTDADAIGELLGAAIFIMEGSVYGSTSWVQSNTYADTFDDLIWTQFSGTGAVTAGAGITIDGTAVAIDRTTVDGWYDASGAAATAQSAAQSYADGLAVNYDPAGTAAAAVAALSFPKKHTETNLEIVPVSGVASWTISAATHGIGSLGSIIVQMKEVSGAIVDADIFVNESTGIITITWNSATTVTAGTYRITAMG